MRMNGRELKCMLKESGLKVTGHKDAKVNRLLQYQARPAMPAPEQKATTSKTNPIYCCVPMCHSRSQMDGVKLHRIPAGPKRRKVRRQWIKRLRHNRANLILSNGTRVCSQHFKKDDYKEDGNLLPSAVPTVFPFKQEPTDKPTRKRPLNRSDPIPDPMPDTVIEVDIEPLNDSQSREGIKCPSCSKKRSVADFSCQVSLSDINIEDLRDDDKKTRFYTHFVNFGTFMVILGSLIIDGKDRLNYWGRKETHQIKKFHQDTTVAKHGPDRKLDMATEFLATMIWYRLGLLEEHLAYIFKVHQTTMSRILITWSQFIYERAVGFVTLPSCQNVLNNMPHHFINHQNVYIVYDCTEFKMEKPSGLMAQNLTWSEYKHNNTIKVLIGVTPDGHTIVITPCWGGRASDRHIVIKEDSLSVAPKGMAIMADKGFEVEDLLPEGVKLITPPKVSTKTQMSDYDFYKTVDVAEPRIIVEMKMEQAKNFRLLQDTFRMSRISTANQIIFNAFAFTNLHPQLFVTENYQERDIQLPIFMD